MTQQVSIRHVGTRCKGAEHANTQEWIRPLCNLEGKVSFEM